MAEQQDSRPSDSALQSDQPAANGSNSKQKLRFKTKYVVGGLLALAIVSVLGVSIILIGRHHKDFVATKPVDLFKSMGIVDGCTDDVLTQSAKDLQPLNMLALKKDAVVIAKSKNYDKDPSCMYVLTLRYIYDNDLTNARKSLVQLSSVYDHSVGLRKPLNKSNLPTESDLPGYVQVLVARTPAPFIRMGP